MPTPSSTLPDPIPATTNRPTVSWGAVFGGMITALAIQIGLAQLCAAVGLAMYQPFNPGEPTAAIAITTIVAWLLCALIGLFIGGWAAARLAHYQSRVVAALHGVLVWATGAVIAGGAAVVLVAAVAGGTIKVAGETLQAAAGGAQAVGSSVASMAAPSWDAVRDQLKEAGNKLAAAAKDGEAENLYANQSRIMDLAGKFFATDKNARLTPAERDELTTLASAQLGISKDAAAKTLTQWERSWDEALARYETVKEQAKAKAKEAAVEAKKFAAAAAGFTFGLMLVSVVAAIAGSVLGNACFRREEQRDIPTSARVVNA